MQGWALVVTFVFFTDLQTLGGFPLSRYLQKLPDYEEDTKYDESMTQALIN